jgi:hypothetical protein
VSLLDADARLARVSLRLVRRPARASTAPGVAVAVASPCPSGAGVAVEVSTGVCVGVCAGACVESRWELPSPYPWVRLRRRLVGRLRGGHRRRRRRSRQHGHRRRVRRGRRRGSPRARGRAEDGREQAADGESGCGDTAGQLSPDVGTRRGALEAARREGFQPQRSRSNPQVEPELCRPALLCVTCRTDAIARHPPRRPGGRRRACGHHAARLRVLPRVGARRLAAAAAQPRIAGDPRTASSRARPGARWRSRPAASPRATSGSPTRPSATARTSASPAGRTCGCCSCARNGGGSGWRRSSTGWRSRRRRAAAMTRSALHAGGPGPRAPLLRARGLGGRGRPFAEPLLGLDLGSTAARSTDRIPAPSRRPPSARAVHATRWERVRVAWRA